MKSKPIRWGILGAGGIARTFVAGARVSRNGNDVIAVASQTEGKSRTFAAEQNLPLYFDGYDALLACEDVDAVYVANTHNLHHDAVVQALQAGKHVLCEKPLAVNAAQVKDMLAAVRKSNRFLMEAMWTRFLPACVQLMDWIREGRIGEVLQIEASFGIRGQWPAEGRMLNPDLAGGALLDLGIYPLAFASGVMHGAKPERIHSLHSMTETGVDGDSIILFQYAEGPKAVLRTSLEVSLENRAVVMGTQGRVTLPATFIGQTEVHLRNDTGDETACFPLPENTGFRFEIEHAADCIRLGLTDSPVMPLAESLALAETMDILRANWGFRYPFEPKGPVVP